jgi:RNA 2',3'-cyclic 3'-phosphodiesterase
MHRLFVALRPPRSAREALRAVQSGVPGARWQDDDQLHLTLRFIGEVDRPVAEDVAAALEGVRAPAPLVAVAGVGTFDSRGRADTLWAGVQPRDPLAALHRKVDQACVRAGVEPERRAYLPHVTLARLPRSLGAAPEVAAWQHRHAALATEPFTLGHLLLYESHLGREGASYEPVLRVALDA